MGRKPKKRGRPQLGVEDRKDALALVKNGWTRLEVAELLKRDRSVIGQYTKPEMLEVVDDWTAPPIDVVVHRARARKAKAPNGQTAAFPANQG
jgi:hypothetical protein